MTGEAAHESVGQSLQRLRTACALSLGEASRRSEVPSASIRDWESGRYLPTGSALVRLLDALEAPSLEAARLLAMADPRHARIELAHTVLGPPVDAGQVLRALRVRSRSTQAAAAHRIGVGQSAFAKWESGDSVPSEETFLRALSVLGATPEESTAARAIWTAGPGSSCLNRPASDEIEAYIYRFPSALREVLLLGFEADLWWRSTREPAVKALLCHVVSLRAHTALFHGQPDQLNALAGRAIRLARESGALSEASRAVYALCWHRQRLGRDPGGAVQILRDWRERLKARPEAEWLQSAEALAMVRAGAADEGISVLQSIERRILREGRSSQLAYIRTDLVDANLLAGRPHRAADILSGMGLDAPLIFRLRVKIAIGEEPERGDLERYCGEADRENRVDREQMAQIERGLTRIRKQGVRLAPVASI